MIKLNRTPKPVELTTESQASLTAEFKATGKSVWNLDFIKNELLRFSNDKCCYCEANVNEESKYMEVEHFHHKDKYQDEVLEWENLLPACKKCNGNKSYHDTITEPIINPAIDDPKSHLMFWNYRMKGKDDFGKLTISVLDLNNQVRLVKKRFEVGNAIHDKLEQLNEFLDDFINGIQNSTRRKNRIINGAKDLMKEGLPTSIYSATSATIILTDTEFSELKSKLILLEFWDAELIELESDLSKTALELKK